MVIEGIPLSEWSGSGATRELQETIRQFNEKADKQTQQMIRLTRGILWLSLVMVAAVLAQIVLAITMH
ncbi:MAG: hypothetical protein M1274_15355 [Actinobacteria bacterium]|nr:hypothetical protein [Actinomycetota bacterium]